MNGGGYFVNTASIAGCITGFSPSYDASKHAVVAITEELFNSMHDAGTSGRRQLLCPGWVRTGIIDSDRNWPRSSARSRPRTALVEVIARARRAGDRRRDDTGRRRRPRGRCGRAGSLLDLPARDFLEMAVERFHRIAEQVDPIQGRETPGLPPQEQIVAEVIEALSRSDG